MMRVTEEIFSQGGLILPTLFLVSFVIWYSGFLSLYRFYTFHRARKNFMAGMDMLLHGENYEPHTGNSRFDTLLILFKRVPEKNVKMFKVLYREFLMGAVGDLSQGLTTISVWISVAPLLGLLGTVTGMVATFRSIMLFGTGSPGFMAEGISIALVTTKTGLAVAVPALLFHLFLVNMRNRLKQNLIQDGKVVAAKISVGETV